MSLSTQWQQYKKNNASRNAYNAYARELDEEDRENSLSSKWQAYKENRASNPLLSSNEANQGLKVQTSQQIVDDLGAKLRGDVMDDVTQTANDALNGLDDNTRNALHEFASTYGTNGVADIPDDSFRLEAEEAANSIKNANKWDDTTFNQYLNDVATLNVHEEKKGTGGLLTPNEEVKYSRAKISTLDKGERELVNQITEGQKLNFVHDAEYQGRSGQMLLDTIVGKIRGNEVKRGDSQITEAQNKLREQYGWDDDQIKEYTLMSERVANSEETNKATQKYAVDPNASGAVKTAQSVVNTVDAVSKAPKEGYMSVLSNFREKPKGFGRDTNTATDIMHNTSEEAVQQVSQNAIGDDHKVAQFLYNAGVSTAESGLNVALSGAMGGMGMPQKVAEAVSLGAFSTSAYSSVYEQSRERGLNEEQAQKLGVAAGAAEAITEKVSLDNLWDLAKGTKVGKQLLVGWLAQAGIEGSEEMASDILNRIADDVVAGDNSERQQKMNALMEENPNMTEDEAMMEEVKGFLGEMLMDGLAGALSGGIMGAGGVATGMSNAKYNQQRANAISEDYGSREYDTSTKYGQNKQSEAESYAQNPTQYLADRIDDTTEEGKKAKKTLQEYAAKEASGKDLTMSERNDIENIIHSVPLSAQQEAPSYVPDEYKNISNSMTEDEAREQLAKAAKDGDAQAMGETLQQMHSSKNASVRVNADKIFEEYVGMAQSHGAQNIDSYKMSNEEAYVRGFMGQEVGEVSDKARAAYLAGQTASSKNVDGNFIDTDIHKAKIANTSDTLTGAILADGKMLTSSGKTVSISDVEFENAATKKAFTYAEAQPSLAAQNAYISGIKEGTNVDRYDIAWKSFFRAGRIGIDFEKATTEGYSGYYANLLGEDTVRQMYDAGVAQTQFEKQSKVSADLNKALGRKGAGTFEDARTNKNGISTEAYRVIANVTGLDIKLVDDAGENVNAYFDPNTSTVVVSEQSANQILHEVVGEFTELYNSDGYNALKATAMNVARTSLNDARFNKVMDAYADAYGKAGEENSDSEMAGEMTNDLIVAALSTEKGQKAFADYLTKNYSQKEATTLKDKVVGLYRGIVKSLKSLANNSDMNGYQKELLNKHADELDQMTDQIISAFDTAIKNYKSRDAKSDANRDVVYSLEVQVDKYLGDFSEKQKELWKNSKNIILCEDTSSVLNFVNDAVNKKNLGKKLYFGIVPNEVAELVENKFGYDIHNYNVALGADEVRKIAVIDHGDEQKEQLRGQRAVLPSDFAEIPAVIGNPEDVQDGGIYFISNNSLIFKRNGITVVAVIRRKSLDLYPQTMYISNKNRSLATPVDELASTNTPKAGSGTASTKNVPQTQNAVNQTAHSLSIDTEGNTLSEAQQKFFEDSKVRDENGSLRVVYHGTWDSFNVFKANEWVGETDGTTLAKGYFSTSRSYSEGYGEVKPYYLNIKNPLDFTDMQKNTELATMDRWKDWFKSKGVDAKFDSGIKTDTLKGGVFEEGTAYFPYELIDAGDHWHGDGNLTHAIQAAGYDGMVWIEGNEDDLAYIPFSENQIKLTTNTEPTSLPDIRYSIDVDTEGNTLSKAQQEYFKDSKVRDEDGALKVMYHGTSNGNFHVFDTEYSDDGTSLFFTDNNSVAKTYSGTFDKYAAKTIESLEELNGIFTDEYECKEENGQYALYEDGRKVAESDTLDGMLKEYNEWTGADEGVKNYEVYLNITNPLVVDADNNNWDELPEFEGATTTREYASLAKEKGYDGVIFNNIVDGGLYGTTSEKNTPSTVAIVFDSNQIKSTANNAPTDDLDIRYSIDVDTDGYLTADENYDPLMDMDYNEENIYSSNPSQTTGSILADGMEALKGHSVDEKSIRRVAKNVLNAYNSTMDVDKLTDELSKVFAYMQTNAHVNFDDMMRVMQEVASPMVDMAADPQQVKEYNQFVNRLKGNKYKLTDVQLQEVKNQYGSLAEFKRALGAAGQMISQKADSTLEANWDELSLISGRVLDEYANEGDQPMALVDALDAMKPTASNGFGLNSEGVKRDAAMRIVEEYLRSTNDSKAQQAADAMKKKYTDYRKQTRQKYDEKLRTAKEELRDRYRGRVSDLKGRQIDELATLRAKNTERNQKARDRRLASHEKDMIQKHASDMYKWIATPTEEHHVPHDMVMPLTDFLSAFDFVEPEIKQNKNGEYYARILNSTVVNEDGNYKNVFDTITGATREEVLTKYSEALGNGKGSKAVRSWRDKMSGIADLMHKVQSDGSSFESGDMNDMLDKIDPALAQEFTDMLKESKGVANINQLSYKDLHTINSTMRNVIHAINQGNKAFASKNGETIDRMAEGVLNRATETKAKNKKNAVVEATKDFFRIEELSPRTFFRLNDSMSVYKNLREGWNTKTMDVKKASDFMSEIRENHKDISKWDGGKNYQEMRTDNGVVIRYTPAQAMGLYELSKREQAEKHFSSHFRFDTLRNGQAMYEQKKVILTRGDIANIIDSLTTEQKSVADQMQKYMATECAKQGNEASMKMYGIEKFTEEHYYPITTDKDTNASKNSDIQGNKARNSIERAGMTKATQANASNPIVIRSIFDVFTNHTVQMAEYHGLAPALKDTNRWLNYKNVQEIDGIQEWTTVKSALDTVNGNKGKQYVDNLITDINGGEGNRTVANPISFLTGKYKAAAIAYNMRVVVQQPTAYFRALNDVDAKYLFSVTPAQAKAASKKMAETSAISWWKSQGYYETSIGKSMKEIITGESSALQKVQNLGMEAAGKADDVTWSVLYAAVTNEQKAKHKGQNLTEEQLTEKINERFDEVVDKTQVVDTTLHRSQLMRNSDGIMQMFTAFMAEPTKSYNMLYEAAILDSRDGVKSLGKRTRKAAIAWGLASIVNVVAKSAYDIIRYNDDDDDLLDTFLERLEANAKDDLNPINMIPVVSDIYEKFAKFVEGEKSFSSSTGLFGLDALTTLFDTATDVRKFVNGAGNKTAYGVAQEVIKVTSQLSGTGVYNIERDLMGVYNIFNENMYTSLKDQKGAHKEQMLDAIDTDEGAIEQIEKYIQDGAKPESIKGTMTSGWKTELIEKHDAGENVDELVQRIAKARAYIDETYTKPQISSKYNDDYVAYETDVVNGWLVDAGATEFVDPEVAKAQEAKEQKTAYKNDLYNAIDSGSSSGYREAINNLSNTGMDYSDIKSAINSQYKADVLARYNNGEDVTKTLSRIATVKAYCDEMSGKNIAKKYNGDYYSYEWDHIMEWFK